MPGLTSRKLSDGLASISQALGYTPWPSGNVVLLHNGVPTPYASYAAAAPSAGVGDTIIIQNSFTENGQVGKNGVDINIMPGVTWTVNASGNPAFIDTSGRSYNVSGDGILQIGAADSLITISNVNSTINFNVSKIDCQTGNGFTLSAAGTLRFNCLDGIYNLGDSNINAAGLVEFNIPVLTYAHDAFIFNGAAGVVKGWIGRATGTGSGAIFIQQNDVGGKIQLSGNLIDNSASSLAAISDSNSGFDTTSYLNYKRIIGWIDGFEGLIDECTIDNSASSSNPPLKIYNNNLSLKNCVLLKHASQTNHASAGSAKTVTYQGSLGPNSRTTSNVTFSQF